MTIDWIEERQAAFRKHPDVRMAHAVRDVQIAVADLMLLIVTSESSSELERIRTETNRLIASLEAVASSALDRAERL